MVVRNFKAIAVVVTLVGATVSACGQGPSFLDREAVSKKSIMGKSGSSSGSSADASGQTAGSNPTGSSTEEVAGEGAAGGAVTPGVDGIPGVDGNGDSGAGSGGAGGDVTTTGPVSTYPAVPGVDGDDLDALHKCMAKWNTAAFGQTVKNYRKISASVSVFGMGTPINDTERTVEPQLVLITAGVNVLGTTTWNLLNPNGYYCMKVNVNVQETFNINLHCNARLADNVVNVNVGSNQNNTTAGVGVNVLSTVTVSTIRPEGDQCVR